MPEERKRIHGLRCGGFVVEAIGNGRYRMCTWTGPPLGTFTSFHAELVVQVTRQTKAQFEQGAKAIDDTELTTTDAPSAASDLAMPAPIPFDAPVTIATLPLSLLMTSPDGGLAVVQ